MGFFTGPEERQPLQGEPPPEIPRDQWDRPYILKPDVDPADVTPEEWASPRGNPRFEAYTRASSLGDALEDSFGITQWKQWIALKGAAAQEEICLAVAVCAENDRVERRRLIKQAHEAGGGTSAASIGTALHKVADVIDLGGELPPLRGAFAACAEHYRSITGLFRHRHIERFVVNDRVKGAGTGDRFVSPDGWMTAPDGTRFGPDSVLAWDLKTPETARYFGPKFIVQLDTYAGGEPYEHGKGRLAWDLAPQRNWGLICHLPRTGEGVQLYWADLRPQVIELMDAPLVNVALAVRTLRKAKLFYPAKLPEQQAVSGLNEVGFAAELRACTSPEQVEAVAARLEGLLSDAQVDKLRKRWMELKVADREPVA